METTIKELNLFWEELHQFNGMQTEAAIHHATHFLCEKLGAVNAMWLASVQFPNGKPENAWGWRPQGFFSLHEPEQHLAEHEKHLKDLKEHQAKQLHIAVAEYANTTYRTFTCSRDMPAKWFDSAYYIDYLSSSGVKDMMFVAQPITENSESYFVFVSDRFFSDDEISYAALACAPLLYLHKAMMAHHGIGICEHPLTPSEKRLLAYLLQEKSEPEIAAEIHLSPSTVHTYANRIYKKYGVKGRTGLMALWLSF